MRSLSYEPLLGILTLRVDGVATHYGLDRLAHEYGPAVGLYRLMKFGSSDIHVVTRAGAVGRCTCPGFRFRGGCRHVDALAALALSGRLE
jgi:hypothetical protein